MPKYRAEVELKADAPKKFLLGGVKKAVSAPMTEAEARDWAQGTVKNNTPYAHLGMDTVLKPEDLKVAIKPIKK